MILTALSALFVGAVADDAATGWELSGALRERVTHLSADWFDDDEGVDAHWTQRIMLDVEQRFANGVDLRVQFISALNSEDASIIDRNALDFHEAYLDIPVGDGELRVGRHMLSLGSQRLVGTRLGTNVPRTWDGVRYTQDIAGWDFQVLAYNLVFIDPDGVFNDSSTDDHQIAGFYASREIALGSLDLYMLGSWREQRLTIQGLSDQTRYSLGARWFGGQGPWSWNFEAVYQTGDHGDIDIRAWTLASTTSYRFAAPWSPQLIVSTNVASGDDDPNNDTLGTFDPLYPRGNYFSELALLGPANFYNVHPRIMVYPREDLTLYADVNFFWRLEDSDGVYAPSGALRRLPGTSSANAVSQSFTAGIDWEVSNSFLAELAYTRVEPDRFIEDSGSRDTINFIELTLTKRF